MTALIAATLMPDPDIERGARRSVLHGDAPDQWHPAVGCRFASRCPIAEDRCHADEPQPNPRIRFPIGGLLASPDRTAFARQESLSMHIVC